MFTHVRKTKEMLLGVMTSLLIVSLLGLAFNIQPVKADPKTRTVDDGGQADFQTIQEAINAADPGDTIHVLNGTYCEHVIVNKSVTLIGSGSATTVIDGEGQQGVVVLITKVANVAISGFTIKNTTGMGSSGLGVVKSVNISISDNILKKSYYGIQLSESNNTQIVNNIVTNNFEYGIYFSPNSSHNCVIGNTIAYNPTGVKIDSPAKSNLFYHNNFVNNTFFQVETLALADWDNGVEGNYWSDYIGTDLYHGPCQNETGSDGIGDTGYVIVGIMADRYPLMEPWSLTRTFTVNSSQVLITCNCTVASFNFSQQLKQISFFITGPQNSSAFCNVTIPKELLAPSASESWLVILGSEKIAFTNRTIDDCTFMNFTCTLSTHKVRIRLVKTPNLPPYADFAYFPTNPTIFDTVNFTNLSNDPDGYITHYSWDFGDGTNSSEPTPSHNYTQKETFQITLTVQDNNGSEDFICKKLMICNIPPYADFAYSPANPTVRENVQFIDNSTDLDPETGEGIIHWFWDFDDGNSSIKNPTHQFGKYGMYNVSLTVTDDRNDTGTVWKIVTVTKMETTLTINVSSSSVILGEPVFITALLKDQNGNPAPNEKIDFTFSKNKTSISIGSFPTNDTGVATVTYVFSITGEYSIHAVYNGSIKYMKSSVNRTLFVNLRPTALYTIAPSSATVGKKVCIVAILKDENGTFLNNEIVDLSVREEDNWTKVDSAMTNSSGVATFTYTPKNMGVIQIRADFHKTEVYNESHSNVVTLNVDRDYTNYIIITALVVAAIAAIVFGMLIKKRKTAETTAQRAHGSS